MKKSKFIIIDGNALIHRSFHALPPLQDKDGRLVNAVYGFTTVLLKALKEFKPDYFAVTFDVSKKTFRHKEYAKYKAQRVKQPQELYDQIPITKEVVRAFDIPIYEKEGWEADDVIATISDQAAQAAGAENLEKIIVTGDLDALQLIDEHTKVYTLRKGLSDTVTYEIKTVKERYGLLPGQMIDFKALAGDSSDNLPGVRGIGEKTAIDLLKQFGDLDNLYEALGRGGAEMQNIRDRVKKLLLEHKEEAYLCRKLAAAVHDVPVNFKLADCEVRDFDQDKIINTFRQLGFKSLLSRIPGAPILVLGSLFDMSKNKAQEEATLDAQEKQANLGWVLKPSLTAKTSKHKNYLLIDAPEKFRDFLDQLKKQKEFAIDTETDGLDPLQAELLGISFAWQNGAAYYLDAKKMREDKLWDELGKILADDSIKKAGHNLKFDLRVLRKAGLPLAGLSFDTMLASYILNPGTRQHSLDTLAFVELGHRMIPITALIGEGKKQINMSAVPVEKVSIYSCEDADYTWRLKEKFVKEIQQKKFDDLLEKIEMPLVPVLASMEDEGVKIDAEFLQKMSGEVGKRLEQLEKKIHQLAGVDFNINSPLQLKEVLFAKLKIEHRDLKMTKTGISTAASELEKLKGRHPIIELISENRELAKLKNTYLDALPELVNKKTGRVHASFNQTITATGRLSSSNPNLQNIPIRTELGREIRKAFIASAGFKILAADYSQIELRVVASLANDKKMIAAFDKGEDIHARTAAEVYEVALDKVTPQMRRSAKAINFGIIYGMGPMGLAQAAQFSIDEAREYIEKYFEIHEGIKNYLEASLASAKELGYAETLFGRRRYLPDIHSGVPQVRAAAERMAINMPVQGTAADLIKLAMIKISQGLPKISPQSKMIMQVHDELVFEAPDDEVKRAAEFVKEAMENVCQLKAPIEVKVEAGKNWGELI